MFKNDYKYTAAVTGGDDNGLEAGLTWCAEQMVDDDTITIWTHTMGNFRAHETLSAFVSRYSDVRHVAARGGAFVGKGPVLMAWADLDDIGPVLRSQPRAICVAEWGNLDSLAPWAREAGAEVIGDLELPPAGAGLDPVVVEALKSMTLRINHGNTISATFEKRQTAGLLLALHDAGYRFDPTLIQAWALAHGWSGENPSRLAAYASDIAIGKRPRVDRVPVEDVNRMRERVAGQGDL